MVNEVVKYHNDLNSVSMRNWTSEEMNFFFSIIAKIRDQSTREVSFNKESLADLASYSITHNKRFQDTIESLAKKVANIHYIERTSNSFELINLFTKFKFEWNDDLSQMDATVKVSEEFEYIVNQLQVEFTTYELAEFTNISSTYAKTMYRLLKQWRTVGKKEFGINDFRRIVECPKSYSVSDIDKRILQPTLKELSPFFKNLHVKKIKKNTRGNPVTGYLFTWKAEKTEKWNENKFKEVSQKSYTTSHYKQFEQWLIDYHVIDNDDLEIIRQLEIEVFPFYQRIAEEKTLDDVARHIVYISNQSIKNVVPYLKKSAKNYLRDEISKRWGKQ